MVGVLLGGAMVKVGWRPACRWIGCVRPKAPRRSLWIIVVRGGCPVWVRIKAFVT